MDRLRVGIVGCGEVTQVLHLPSLAQLGDRFTVAAICDVSGDVLAGVGSRWGIATRYQDHTDLLADDGVDVVLVASPHALHAQVALAAMDAGKHVFIEKPMCVCMREADAIVAAQATSGVTVQVGYMRRYAPAFIEARRRLTELGEIRLARVHDVLGQNRLFVANTSLVVRGNDVPKDVVRSAAEREAALIAEAIGDVSPGVRRAYALMLGLSSHDISAMRELLGRPRRVLYAAQRRRGMYLSAAFDYGDFVCQFETGIDDIPRFDAHIEVYGRERMLRVQWDTPYVRNLPVTLTVTEANGRGGVAERTEHPEWGDPFVAEWTAFHEHVSQGTQPKTSPADAREDLALFAEMAAMMEQEDAGA